MYELGRDLVWNLIWDVVRDLAWVWVPKEFILLQIKSKNEEIHKHRYLSRTNNDNIDCLPKTWNHPLVISRLLYDGDRSEPILKHLFVFISSFPKSKSKVICNWSTSRLPAYKRPSQCDRNDSPMISQICSVDFHEVSLRFFQDLPSDSRSQHSISFIIVGRMHSPGFPPDFL